MTWLSWKAGAVGAILILAFFWYKFEIAKAHREGRQAVLAEQAHEAARRNNDAAKADEISRTCQLNPACRLSDDGHRRD